MRGKFSALLLSLPKEAKRDLQLVFLLFNISKLFWARDPCLALPRDNLCQHLCTDLDTAAARSKVRGFDFASPTPGGASKGRFVRLLSAVTPHWPDASARGKYMLTVCTEELRLLPLSALVQTPTLGSIIGLLGSR